ncbi:hypothetical protein H8788_11995 [Parabacteroides faecis]|jgi:hypothetical protein|uniref:hypothetical protein n=1 Tax=Parabacteroides TaxID=375288 RepID=UPI000F005BF3|nr:MULTISPECIES: hypothetical protein [Parabacteroides]MBC8618465.1 hypothetical protein [Parabacteroides faecis]RHR40043.1 hypothetical protein DWX23_08765 [Parabacteroides sp. AF18-52]RHR94820.1 hypothetical protein DWW23_18775 [Parabacteroides sp. AF14-59]
MKNFINQFECKEVKAGEVVYDTEQMGNILLFVTAGKLLICSIATPVVEVNAGYFVLLPAEKRHIVTAITDVQTVLMHAGTLSTMITEDPEWNPERPVVLPTFPSLAKTIFLLESYQKEKRSNLN